jgi:hypothetical protein
MNAIILTAFMMLMPSQDIMLPDTIPAQSGMFVTITAKTSGEEVRFVALDPGLSVFPANLLSDKKSTVVVAVKDGAYRVLAYTSIANKPSAPAFTTIVVGNSPTPPAPPTPPTPPTPPNPPMPEKDPLLDSMKGVFGGLQESDKGESVKRLQRVYELGSLEADNKKYKNLSELYTAVRSLAVQSLKADKISPIRDMIADELDNKIGTEPSATLDDALRAKCKQQFSRMGKLLGGLNG